MITVTLVTAVLHNGIHNTTAVCRPHSGGWINKRQAERIRTILCPPDAGCACAGYLNEEGPQNVTLDATYDGDNVHYVRLTLRAFDPS